MATPSAMRQDSAGALNLTDVSLPIPDELIDALARRLAEIVLTEMEADLRPSQGRWLRAKEAADYLGWTRSALYARVHAHSVPHYKIDRMLLFRRDELDRWLDEHRVEPWSGLDYRESPAQPSRSPQRQTRPRSRNTAPGADDPLEKPPRQTRERPLPPPIGGTEEQKDSWAHNLEITRAELDEMSPTNFNKAWKARNERLEAAGVFEHLDALYKKYGEEIFSSMSPTELTQAVNELDRSAPSRAVQG
jgi:excisionase family DNA binding protein